MGLYVLRYSKARLMVRDWSTSAATAASARSTRPQEAVVKGVSTRKIEAVLEELGMASVSAGQVSQLCVALDEKVRRFREGPLGEVAHIPSASR